MSVQDEINRLAGNVTASLDAVGARGVEVPEGANSNDLATLIAAIPAGGGTQADWAVNDPEDPAYVKNRPFYKGAPTLVEVSPLHTYTFYEDSEPEPVEGIETVVAGDECIVTFDGVEYETTAVDYAGVGVVLGDASTMGLGESTGEPFVVMYIPSFGLNYAVPPEMFGDTEPTFPITYTMSIHKADYEYVKISKKYLPDDVAYADESLILPGEGLLAVKFNSEANTASGTQSAAMGYACKATGDTAFAGGSISRAEGVSSFAYGKAAEACGEEQHVIGRYNVRDESGVYAFIVGNGDNSAATNYTNVRSNAHTLDWDGNAWYAGTVEGTALIIKSPNGTRYKVTVSDAGALSATKL